VAFYQHDGDYSCKRGELGGADAENSTCKCGEQTMQMRTQVAHGQQAQLVDESGFAGLAGQDFVRNKGRGLSTKEEIGPEGQGGVLGRISAGL
jgi:hypothetical protein